MAHLPRLNTGGSATGHSDTDAGSQWSVMAHSRPNESDCLPQSGLSCSSVFDEPARHPPERENPVWMNLGLAVPRESHCDASGGFQTLRWFRQDIGIEGPTTEG